MHVFFGKTQPASLVLLLGIASRTCVEAKLLFFQKTPLNGLVGVGALLVLGAGLTLVGVFFEAQLFLLVGDKARDRSDHGHYDGPNDARDYPRGVSLLPAIMILASSASAASAATASTTTTTASSI